MPLTRRPVPVLALLAAGHTTTVDPSPDAHDNGLNCSHPDDPAPPSSRGRLETRY